MKHDDSFSIIKEEFKVIFYNQLQTFSRKMEFFGKTICVLYLKNKVHRLCRLVKCFARKVFWLRNQKICAKNH